MSSVRKFYVCEPLPPFTRCRTFWLVTQPIISIWKAEKYKMIIACTRSTNKIKPYFTDKSFWIITTKLKNFICMIRTTIKVMLVFMYNITAFSVSLGIILPDIEFIYWDIVLWINIQEYRVWSIWINNVYNIVLGVLKAIFRQDSFTFFYIIDVLYADLYENSVLTCD